MDPRTLNHPSNIPDPAFRPQNISRPMPDIDVIYVETAMSGASQEDHASHGTLGQGLGQGQGAGNANGGANASVNMNDVAGVLRRNQACLACRRRKLVCLDDLCLASTSLYSVQWAWDKSLTRILEM
jgi:hypothetical protein